MLISDEDLAIIDAAASPNRTAFMVAAAKDVAARVRRVREDSEIEAIMRENAADDAAIAAEFESTLSDGL
jgi:SOS-response transcriptional repressor LexA